MSKRLRNFVFTVNNYTDEHYSILENVIKPVSRYLVYGREVGENGTPHLQGYCQLKGQGRRSALKKKMPGFWFEEAKDPGLKASNYCKKDGDFVESGTLKRTGARNDIHAMYTMIKENKRDYEIQESNPSGYCRYHRGLDRMRLNHQRENKKFQPVKVSVYWGDAGCGKSKRAYEEDPDLYHYASTNGNVWFDGYYGQKTLLFNDFCGSVVRYTYLLELLDGYKYNIPVKGGFAWKQWDRVIICSNQHPRDWYAKGFTPALQRRIDEIIHFDSVGGTYYPPTSETKMSTAVSE